MFDPVCVNVYSIQHYMVKFVNDLQQDVLFMFLIYIYVYWGSNTISMRCSIRVTVTGQVSYVEQALLAAPEHLSSPPVFDGVRVTLSLVFCVAFCISLFVWVFSCLFLCRFSFGHCVVCPSSIYGFLLPFWYFQTFLKMITSECY